MTDVRTHRTICRSATILASELLLCALMLTACRKGSLENDPQIRTLQQRLQRDFPVGTNKAIIKNYLELHQYTIDRSDRPGVLVAELPRSTDISQQSTVRARVTFYFDANGNLNTFELSRP